MVTTTIVSLVLADQTIPANLAVNTSFARLPDSFSMVGLSLPGQAVVEAIKCNCGLVHSLRDEQWLVCCEVVDGHGLMHNTGSVDAHVCRQGLVKLHFQSPPCCKHYA